MRAIAGAAFVILLTLGGCQEAGERPDAGRVPDGNEQPGAEETTPDESDRAPIVVDAPTDGEELTSPAILSGSANVFEATVSYRIVAADGDIVARGFTTATCGSGCRGTYSVTIPFEVEERTDATMEVFEESAEDGRPLHKVAIPVVLLP